MSIFLIIEFCLFILHIPKTGPTMITFQIVIVDDDEDDRELLREAFEKAGIEPVLVVSSAQALFRYLQKIEDNRFPSLIVTDLNMPETNGLELLKTLKTTERLKTIPVVVWSTANDPKEMKSARLLGAEDYVIKPIRLTGYQELINRFRSYAIV